jgi:glycogen(starch) synthase
VRILTVGSLYPPHHFGGYELLWQAAVRALRAAGHDVRVLCVADRRPDAAAQPEDPGVHRELAWYCRDYHAFPRLPRLERLRLERHNHAVLRRHLSDQRPQLVSWWAMGGMSLSLVERVRRARLPALGWVINDWLIYGPGVDQWLAFWNRAGWLATPAGVLMRIPTTVDLAGAARWVFCSEAMRRSSLLEQPRLVDTAVVHLGVSPDFAAQPEHPWQGRLLYAGRLDERKGVGTLIDAVAGLRDCTLRIVGDGESAAVVNGLRERARAAGGRIVFEPAVPRSELARVYAHADAVVFPVEWLEPWGLVPLEGMASGRPIIATGQGGSAEYLEHERNAVLFPPGDVEALRAAVRRLAGDQALRARLREGGLATARRFTEAGWLDVVVAEHERLMSVGWRNTTWGR